MKHRLLTLAALALTTSATACHSDGPKTIEDVRPSGQVCFPRSQPDSRGQPNGSDATPTTTTTHPAAPQPAVDPPTTVPTTQASAHGTPGHWCALCAAAAARAAEQGRDRAVVLTPESDLMSDLPQR